jgi:ATP-dependent Clp protease ATP-binding subunit ClpB
MDESNKEEVIDKTRNMVFEILKQSVRPEFLNRIDEVIMFQPLSEEDIRAIVELQLDDLKKVLARQDVMLSVAEPAVDWLAEEGYNPEFGARPVKRLIQKNVMKELSKQMLLGKIQPKSHIVLDIFDGKIVFRAPINEETIVSL